MSRVAGNDWSGAPEIWTVRWREDMLGDWPSQFWPGCGYHTETREPLPDPLIVPDGPAEAGVHRFFLIEREASLSPDQSALLTNYVTAVSEGAGHLDVQVRSIRALIGRRHLLLVCPRPLARQALAAVIRYYELRRLLFACRDKLKNPLAMIGGYGHLTHAVRARDLGRQKDVNGKTQETLRIRTQVAMAQSLMEAPGTLDDPLATRLFHELVQQDGLVAEYAALEDILVLLSETWSTANDRLTEFRYFLYEMIAEILIIALLAADLILRGLDWAP